MNRSADEIREILAGFHPPDRKKYPELDGYSRDEIHEDFFGGGGLYLAIRMARTMRLQPDDVVLDLGCGKGSSSIFLAKHYGVRVIALDLWTSVDFLEQKFSAAGLLDRITPMQMDATQHLPFALDYFDSIFCMNSFNFYGGTLGFIERLLKHLKPGRQICIGSEVLTSEFTREQLKDPPPVYAFTLPPPNERVNVFEDDFRKQHTPGWWRKLFETSGLLQVEHCQKLEDSESIYEELVRFEHEHNIDAFDVKICLDQMEWGRTHEPRKTLFVLTARKQQASKGSRREIHPALAETLLDWAESRGMREVEVIQGNTFLRDLIKSRGYTLSSDFMVMREKPLANMPPETVNIPRAIRSVSSIDQSGTLTSKRSMSSLI